MRVKVGISLGDVNGIGIELLLKTFQDERLSKQMTPIFYGSSAAINFYKKHLGIKRFHYNVVESSEQARPGKFNLIEVVSEINITPGSPSVSAGNAAHQSLKRLVQHAKEKLIDAIVTLPIDKSTIQSEEFDFPGHTEFLAKEFEVLDNLMLMVHNDLRIAQVSGHLPIKDVSMSLSITKILFKLKILVETLKFDFNIVKPRIAVLGLNPHAGDNGLIGKEEIEIIAPAIKKAKETTRALIFGPYPADGFFSAGQYKKFDAILAIYHDQGLLPFKLLSQMNGVNFTAGLPTVRTSPDHGVAYNIAGKDIADTTSFLNALYLAVDVFNRRNSNVSLESNALETKKSKNNS